MGGIALTAAGAFGASLGILRLIVESESEKVARFEGELSAGGESDPSRGSDRRRRLSGESPNDLWRPAFGRPGESAPSERSSLHRRPPARFHSGRRCCFAVPPSPRSPLPGPGRAHSVWLFGNGRCSSASAPSCGPTWVAARTGVRTSHRSLPLSASSPDLYVSRPPRPGLADRDGRRRSSGMTSPEPAFPRHEACKKMEFRWASRVVADHLGPVRGVHEARSSQSARA